MGFLFGRKKSPPAQDPHVFLEDFNKQSGNYEFSFEQKYHSNIGKWEKRIIASRQKTKAIMSLDDRISALKESKQLLDAFNKWCCSKKYGKEYFYAAYVENERSMYNRVVNELRECECIKDNVIPAILKCDGELQSEFVKRFDIDPNLVRDEINKLEESGYILRVKKGRSYQIFRK